MSNRTRLAWAWTALIVAACVMPTRGLPISEGEGSMIQIAHLDKLVHFTIFAIFGALWMRAVTAPGRAVRVLAAGVLLAVGTECLQGLPAIGRDPDALDVLADSLGLAVGVAALQFGPRAWTVGAAAPPS